MDKIDAMLEVCHFLTADRCEAAADTIERHYPFQPQQILKGHCTPLESTRVFIRDGFIDRYSGERLIFPPVFRVISVAIPKVFPFHPNWKSDVTHPAYWELGATIDHYKPLSLGGKHEEPNWITTSMAHNAAKQNWTIEQLGLRLHERGNPNEWNGLLEWFLEYASVHPEVLENASVHQWHSAAMQVNQSGPQPLPSSKRDRSNPPPLPG